MRVWTLNSPLKPLRNLIRNGCGILMPVDSHTLFVGGKRLEECHLTPHECWWHVVIVPGGNTGGKNVFGNDELDETNVRHSPTEDVPVRAP